MMFRRSAGSARRSPPARRANTAPRPPTGRVTVPDSTARGRREGVLTLFLFHGALQRVLMAAGEIHYLRDFRFGDLVAEHANDSDALFMDRQHDLERLRVRHAEESLEHRDDEFHRGVIVI